MILFLQIPLHSQDQEEFIGTIQLADKSLITYKLIYSENDEGFIEGKSITDFAGSHRTESVIKGSIDHKEKTISFEEISNASTMSDYPENSFCYIKIRNAKLKIRKKKSLIQGHFVSYYENGDKCVEGDLYLIGEEHYFNKMNKMTKRAKLVVGSEKLKSTELALAETKKSMTQITLMDNESIKFNTSLEFITLILQDPEHEDNDKVSITINDEVYAPSILVLKEPKKFKIPLSNDHTKITISALNEGKIPPNSAKITLLEFEDNIPLVLRLNEGENVNLLFNKSK